jgi:hypothetical protein
MKRVVLVLALAAIIAAGTAFADHPEGFGIGVVGSYGGFSSDFSGIGYGLSLKIPGVPVFWGFNAGFGSDTFSVGDSYFSIGITGDFYVVDQVLSGPLHYFIGVGGLFKYLSYSYQYTGYSYSYSYDYSWIFAGARAPIGISFQPVPLLEFFIDVGLFVGVAIYSGYDYETQYAGYPSLNQKYSYPGTIGFGWDAPVEIGLRLWF